MSSRYYREDYERDRTRSDRDRESDYGRSYGRSRDRESDYDRSYGRRRERYGDESRGWSSYDQQQRSYGSSNRTDFDQDYGRGYDTPYGSTTDAGSELHRSRLARNRYTDEDDSYNDRQSRLSSQRYQYRDTSTPYYGRDYGQRYENEEAQMYASGYGASAYGREGLADRSWYDDQRRQARGSQERSWWDRVTDEISSWFGDHDAERRRQMDEAREGRTHKGKGPKGYRRSDERIREDVNDRLTDYDYLDASDIEVTVAQCVVSLDGSVDSRWAKRIAEDIAETVSGVSDVQNNLRVSRDADKRSIGTGSSAMPMTTTTSQTEQPSSTKTQAQAKGA
jgi:osmotically-inducible protein OsmY